MNLILQGRVYYEHTGARDTQASVTIQSGQDGVIKSYPGRFVPQAMASRQRASHSGRRVLAQQLVDNLGGAVHLIEVRNTRPENHFIRPDL